MLERNKKLRVIGKSTIYAFYFSGRVGGMRISYRRDFPITKNEINGKKES